MRVAIIGSRNFDDNDFARSVVRLRIADILMEFGGELTTKELEFVSGGCPQGVDFWVQEICKTGYLKLKEFLPNLEKFGSPAAYHIRNDDIIDYADKVVAIWNGSRVRSGTWSVINKCRRRDVNLEVYIVKGKEWCKV